MFVPDFLSLDSESFVVESQQAISSPKERETNIEIP